MHLKKAHVLIVLLWKLMCFEAGKFILIPHFTLIIEPSPRRISCLRDGYYSGALAREARQRSTMGNKIW